MMRSRIPGSRRRAGRAGSHDGGARSSRRAGGAGDGGGLRQTAAEAAIAEALTFHEGIGAQRKVARLRHLRDRWTLRLASHERVRLHTSLKPGKSCGIANVEIVGLDPGKLAEHLWQRHHILATPIVRPEFRGLRVTPSVYTTLAEIDQFSEVMVEIAEKGIPK